MVNFNARKFVYLSVSLLTVIMLVTGATYAYWSATTQSTHNAVVAGSTIYSISMEITPLYHGFSLIPMKDEFAIKGLKNKCKDKYGRGACLAYKIRVFDYAEGLNYVSGTMDITTSNMENLSYMMYRVSDEFNEDSCTVIDNKNYCIAKEPEHMKDGVGLSLGDKYDVYGQTETEFILLIWIANLNVSQNDTDIGDFNAIVTMSAGSGGEIKGSISTVIDPTIPNDDLENNENIGNDENIENNEIEETDNETND